MLFREGLVNLSYDSDGRVVEEGESLHPSSSMDSYAYSETPSAFSFEQRMEALQLGSDEEGTTAAYQLFPPPGNQQTLLQAFDNTAQLPEGFSQTQNLLQREGGSTKSPMLYTATSEHVHHFPNKPTGTDSSATIANAISSLQLSGSGDDGASGGGLTRAALLGARFFKYPTSEDLEDDLHSAAEQHVHDGGSPLSQDGGFLHQANTDSCRGVRGAAALPTEEGANGAVLATVDSCNGSPNTSNATCGHNGTKLFLGGLRFEVIQAGRHVISWIFFAACGVRLPPCSILVHRKSKSGKSSVSPTGCASVYVAAEADVTALLGMNQRIFCATEGIYVTPTTEVMRELLSTNAVLDVVDGKRRGPTHPVVIERANSNGAGGDGTSPKLQQHQQQGPGNGPRRRGQRGSPPGSGYAAVMGPGEFSSAPLCSVLSAPPPSFPPPYGVSASVLGVPGSPSVGANSSSTPASHASSLSGFPVSFAVTSAHHHPPQQPTLGSSCMLGLHATSTALPPPQYIVQGQAAAATSSANISVSAGSLPVGDSSMGPPPYYHGSASSLGSTASSSVHSGHATPLLQRLPSGAQLPPPPSSSAAMNERAAGVGAATVPTGSGGGVILNLQRGDLISFHVYPGDATVMAQQQQQFKQNRDAAVTTLFIGGITAHTSELYVSWVFSMLGLPLPAGEVGLLSASHASSGAGGSAVIQLEEGLASVAMSFHKRILCTRDGIFLARSAADLTTFMTSNPPLAELVPLHVDRRFVTASSVNGCSGCVAAPQQHQQQSHVPPPPPGLAGMSAGGLPTAFFLQRPSGAPSMPPPLPPPPPMYTITGGSSSGSSLPSSSPNTISLSSAAMVLGLAKHVGMNGACGAAAATAGAMAHMVVPPPPQGDRGVPPSFAPGYPLGPGSQCGLVHIIPGASSSPPS